MKKVFLLSLIVLLMGTTAFAGGSIFGGHKARTSNPNGVSSIGIHICGSLNCPGVILKNGDCGTVEHATTKYGVCVCDDGYEVKDGKCESTSTQKTDEECSKYNIIINDWNNLKDNECTNNGCYPVFLSLGCFGSKTSGEAACTDYFHDHGDYGDCY